MDMLQFHFLSSLLHGKREISKEEASIRAHALGLVNLLGPFTVAVVAPVYAGIGATEKDATIQMCVNSIRKKMEKSGHVVYCLANEYDNIQIIVNLCSEETNESIERELIQIREHLWKHYSLDAFIGIGSCVKHITEISVSANEASEMLAYKFSYADQGVVNIRNMIRFSHSPNYSSDIRFDRVIGCFQDGDLGRMAIRLEELVEEIRYRPNVSKTAIRRAFIELTVSVLHVAANADVDTESVIHGLDIYKWVLEQQHTEILTAWFLKLCDELHTKMRLQQESSERNVIQTACQYIEANAGDLEISPAAVSEYVGLSPSYFSQLFKKEKGIGLNSYITGTKIERAKMLLITTDYTISAISGQAGFSSTPYFSQVFKKTTGMTPGKFRRAGKIEKSDKI